MKVDRERAGAAIILVPRERVDSAGAPSFEQLVLDVVREAPAQIVIDLGVVEYISSAGLRVLLVAAKESRSRDIDCVLCAMRPEVRKLFDTTGLSRILTIVADRAAALARQ